MRLLLFASLLAWWMVLCAFALVPLVILLGGA